MDSESSFSHSNAEFPDAKLLPVEGGTCLCYRVKQHGRLLFLKRLKPELIADPRHRLALQKEFETGFALDHPNLVRFFSYGDDYILMDYVDGITLSQFINENPDYFNNHKNIDRFLSQLLDVVEYLHKRQIVHLDLKPRNILITRIDHDVKLIDLGYCYTDSYADTTGHTDSFAAPEQLADDATVDDRTDIYAIGKIIKWLNFGNYYNNIAEKCTEHLPDERYQDIEQLRAALFKNKRSLWQWIVPVISIIAIAIYLLMPRNSVNDVNGVPTDIVTDSVSIPTGFQDQSIVNQISADENKQVEKAFPSNAEPIVTKNAHTNDTIPTPTLTHYDFSTAVKDINAIINPLVKKHLDPLRDKSYGDYSEQYRQAYLNFQYEATEKCEQLWDTKYAHNDGVSQREYYIKFGDIIVEKANDLYKAMEKNYVNAYRQAKQNAPNNTTNHITSTDSIR